ncbi:MAG: hypothetical protein PW735_07360 [Acidobacteriaceae bacterium]|nr:hypothetical protein [Acidobacteriaceae bacterium]
MARMRLHSWTWCCVSVMGLALGTGAQAQQSDTAAAAPSASTAQQQAGGESAKAAGQNEPAKKGSLFHKEKVPYTGPTEIIVLPATPILDEEGKQQLDPEGKPMFNPPVQQQRDKEGHPVFDANGKPVFQTAEELGYDQHGKKLHAKKVKPPKTTPLSIARGTFTVDGVIGKAELNYDIADFHFLYLFVPGIGVTMVSSQEFPGSREQKNAFEGATLTVRADEHTLQIGSDKHLLAGKKPVSAYVLVNREFQLPSRYPEVGYGVATKAPYVWPGSKANEKLSGLVAPPPTPVSLKPKMLLAACPQGQMRMPAPVALPGEAAPEQPCVPIEQAEAAEKKQASSAAAEAPKPTGSSQ